MTPSQSLSWRRPSIDKKNESGYDDEKKTVQSIIKTACNRWLFSQSFRFFSFFFLWKCHMLFYTRFWFESRKLIIFSRSLSVTNQILYYYYDYSYWRWKETNDEYFDHSNFVCILCNRLTKKHECKSVKQFIVTPGIISQMSREEIYVCMFNHLEIRMYNVRFRTGCSVQMNILKRVSFC